MNPLLPDTDSEDELPLGWEQKISLTNRIYYVNHKTNSTQWTHPISGKRKAVKGKLPEGWERKIDDDDDDENNVSYYNSNRQQRTFTDPRFASAYELSDNIPNVPKHKELGPNSTTEDVLENINLGNKVVIITGANCGIGFETAQALALHGAHVILACRNVSKANEAIRKIKSFQPDSRLTFIHCDLSSLKSVKEFCDKFLQMNLRLNILILNAATNALPYTLTEDGFETTFQVNHLAQFYMVRLFEKKITESSTRIVFVSSESHRFSTLNVDNVNQEWSPSNFISFMAYNDSKLCNILTANELNRRLGKHNVVAVSCHPGNLVYTNLQRNWWLLRMLYILVRPFTKSANQGASTVVFCAVTDEIQNIGGLYFNNCQQCEPSEQANYPELASVLWQKSEMLLNSLTNKNNF